MESKILLWFKKMEEKEFINELKDYGYYLPDHFEKERTSPENIVERLLEANNREILLGFPIILINILRWEPEVIWESEEWHPNEKSFGWQEKFSTLLAISYWVYGYCGVPKKYIKRTQNILERFPRGSILLRDYEEKLRRSKSVRIGNVFINARLLLDKFNYKVGDFSIFEKEDMDEEEEKRERLATAKHEALEAELLLLEFLTRRQKDIFYKHLEGKAMTKTEREYYYRIIKKKIKILSNDYLHEMAKKSIT